LDGRIGFRIYAAWDKSKYAPIGAIWRKSNWNSPILAAFTNAIDTHNYDEAYQLLQDQGLLPDQRNEALKALRSRLTMLPENAPVWEIYAFLNAKENEPLLADKAQQTANLLKNLSEE